MSEEYIKREAAIDSVKAEMKYRNGTLDYNAGLLRATENLEILPAADVVEARHGRWIYDCVRTTGDGWIHKIYKQYHCSACGKQEIGAMQNYCPNCGAKMTEV